MKQHPTYKRIFQLVWAFAILWISLGSLINFHQHHLWRRQLIPQVVASVNKKDKSRLASQIKQNQDNSKASGIDLLAVTHFKSEPLAHYANVTSVFEAQVYSGDLNTGLNRSDGLRAPPAL